MNTPDICVIYNPSAGRGRAARRMASLRRALGNRAEFHASQGPGHAEGIAVKAVDSGFSILGAAGGDGTVHEVANGLLQTGQNRVALAVFPIGSANDYAHTLQLASEWWLQPGCLAEARSVDVGIVRTPDGRARYFVNGIGIGFNGAVTLEARRIHRLQGQILYTTALLRALCYNYKHPMISVTIDGTCRQVPTLALSVAIGRREGNFVLAPNAIVDDGLFDYLHAGPITRWELLRYVPGMITGNLPKHPSLWMGRCQAVAVHSEAALPVHLDGEIFARPADNTCDLEISILPGRLQIQGCKTKHVLVNQEQQI